MDNVINWLSNFCLDNGIGFIFDKNLPPDAPSDSWSNPKLILLNTNWHRTTELPFMYAHEIGHVVEEYPEYYHLTRLGTEKGEYSANRFAINLLLKYCKEHDIEFATYYQFAYAFGIPRDCYYLLELLPTPSFILD
ncbi:ImmA/IrrE family metallo-endopeptidase [Lactobacillus johnsonii]|nr:ImmA/IrrE family metallo-endopeptidase [Lactobacillus johnsonii]